ncbi:hypothetical protein GHT06_020358 [Daphnia sinensis]|uniref:GAG-pre-integrase domain-containing protein n=1 Tax=Daphnia sinensis TaxID=1820382 RepID=A0AAD5PRI7_9CRUS|nr:hypothetical protein GHT06_020358 [Daphnia sinensis]
MDVLFSDTRVYLSKDQTKVMIGQRKCETLYHLHVTTVNGCVKQEDYAGAAKSNIGLIQERIKTNAVKGLRLEGNDFVIPCEACIFGKMHRIPFPTEGDEKTAEVCDLIHADVGGPAHVPTIDNFRF